MMKVDPDILREPMPPPPHLRAVEASAPDDDVPPSMPDDTFFGDDDASPAGESTPQVPEQISADADAFAAARRAPLREVAALVGMLSQGRVKCPNCNGVDTAILGSFVSCNQCSRKHDAIALTKRAKRIRDDVGAVAFLVRNFGITKPEAPVEPWTARTVTPPAEWYTKAPPRRKWLLTDRRTTNSEGVFPLGKVGQLVAAGGGGKTMVLMQLALAVATGTPWLGVMEVEAPGRVLVILGEEDEEEIHRRIYNAARATSVPTPAPGMIVTLPLAGLPSEMVCKDPNGNPVDAPFLLWLRDYLAKTADQGWKLIVIDPLSRFAGLDAEKDNAQATRFVGALESLVVSTGASVLVAHHSNQASRGGQKVGATAGRGVTGLIDGVRWSATLGSEQVPGLDAETASRLGEVITVSFVKSNYSKLASPVQLRRDGAHGGALVPLDDVDAEIIAEAQANGSPSALRASQRAADRERSSKDDAERRERERAAKEQERAAKERARHAAEDAALRQALIAKPGLNETDLRAQLRARLGTISMDSARACIARAVIAERVETKPGPKNAVLHFIKERTLIDLEGGENLFVKKPVAPEETTP